MLGETNGSLLGAPQLSESALAATQEAPVERMEDTEEQEIASNQPISASLPAANNMVLSGRSRVSTRASLYASSSSSAASSSSRDYKRAASERAASEPAANNMVLSGRSRVSTRASLYASSSSRAASSSSRDYKRAAAERAASETPESASESNPEIFVKYQKVMATALAQSPAVAQKRPPINLAEEEQKIEFFRELYEGKKLTDKQTKELSNLILGKSQDNNTLSELPGHFKTLDKLNLVLIYLCGAKTLDAEIIEHIHKLLDEQIKQLLKDEEDKCYLLNLGDGYQSFAIAKLTDILIKLRQRQIDFSDNEIKFGFMILKSEASAPNSIIVDPITIASLATAMVFYTDRLDGDQEWFRDLLVDRLTSGPNREVGASNNIPAQFLVLEADANEAIKEWLKNQSADHNDQVFVVTVMLALHIGLGADVEKLLPAWLQDSKVMPNNRARLMLCMLERERDLGANADQLLQDLLCNTNEVNPNI